MQNRKELPAETLYIAFHYLTLYDDEIVYKKNLAECALTCRNWRFAAQKFFFSEITLDKVRDIEKLSLITLKNKKLEQWVKTLNLNSYFDLNGTTLITVDLLFPNLEKLDFQTEDGFLYSFFCEALTEFNKFSSLRTIPKSSNKIQEDLYLKCLDYLKTRITSIEITDDCNYRNEDSDEGSDEDSDDDDGGGDNNSNSGSFYKGVLDKLNEYPKLKKIVIYSPNGDISFSNHEEIQYFEEGVIIKEGGVRSLQNISVASTQDSTYLSFYTGNQDTLVPTNSLKKIYIEIYNNKSHFNPCEEFLRLVMKNYSGLDTLNCVDRNKQISYYDSNSPTDTFTATFIQFMNFLSKMRYNFFPNIAMPAADAINLIKNFYVNVNKESTSQTIRSLVIVKEFVDPEYEDTTLTTIENKHSKEQEIVFRFVYNKLPGDLDLELLSVIEQIGQFFDTMSLLINSNKNIVKVLNCISRHCCSHLGNLILTGPGKRCDDLFLCQEVPVKNNSVKTLTLAKFVLSQDHLLYIANQLPSLEYLVLENCFLHSTILGQSFFPICLPYLSLKCLEIDLNMKFVEGTVEKHFYFKLMTDTDHNPRYCFLTAKYKNNTLIGYILMENATEANFQDNALFLGHNENILYLIYCKSVKTFTVKYVDAESGHHKKVDLISNEIAKKKSKLKKSQ